MSETAPRTRVPRRAARKEPVPIESQGPCEEILAARRKAATEIASLVRLAELDASLLARRDELRRAASEKAANERRTLGEKLSPAVREAYDRALRGGRQPAVVRLVGSVCGGCHMRLHSTLDQKIRQRLGAAPCPHCLRLVYDPVWLPS